MPAPTLKTKRLILRHWTPLDQKPFYEMNKDPKVMEFFPSLLSHEQSNDFIDLIQKELEEKTYGLWAVEKKENKAFIGFIGLHEANFEAAFTPCIEIGWRLAYPYWGKGYAYEGAHCVLNYAFEELELSEIVSFTATINKRSIKLMEKLGLKRNPDEDFDHSKVPDGHPLKRHVLYRLKRADGLEVL